MLYHQLPALVDIVTGHLCLLISNSVPNVAEVSSVCLFEGAATAQRYIAQLSPGKTRRSCSLATVSIRDLWDRQ
jgi:hypothetical protein